jgi:MFS family permease
VRRATFAALRNTNYRTYATGAVVSNVGTWMQRVAQDWLVWQLTGSATAVGLAIMAQLLPTLVLSYPGGVVADNVDRRTALLLSQAAMATPSVLIGTLALSDRLSTPILFAVILAFGCATAIDAPLRHAFVADLVPNTLLPNAVGLNSASFNAAQLVGPGLGGLLISAFGSGAQAAGAVVLLNSLSFAAAAFALCRLDRREFIRRTPPADAATAPEGPRRWDADIAPVLWALLFLGIFGMVFRTMHVLMTTVTFMSGASVFGLLSSLLAVGSLAGAVISARGSIITVPRLCGVAALLGVVSIWAGLSPTMLGYAATLPILGFLSQTSTTPAFALLQLRIDEAHRGRVAALGMMLVMGGTALSAPLFGLLAEHTSPRMSFVVGGTGVLVGATVTLWRHGRSRNRVDEMVCEPG